MDIIDRRFRLKYFVSSLSLKLSSQRFQPPSDPISVLSGQGFEKSFGANDQAANIPQKAKSYETVALFSRPDVFGGFASIRIFRTDGGGSA